MPEDKLTGQEERCVLIDSTVRRTPVARIHISTSYYTGMTKAVCMNNPLFDVIVGNIPGATVFLPLRRTTERDATPVVLGSETSVKRKAKSLESSGEFCRSRLV